MRYSYLNPRPDLRTFLNGKMVERVRYVDDKKGTVRVVPFPARLDKYRKRVLERTLHGKVEVRPVTDKSND